MNTVSNIRLMASGHYVLGVVARCRDETLGLVLSVRPSRPSIATQFACVSLSKESAQDVQGFLDAVSGDWEGRQSVSG